MPDEKPQESNETKKRNNELLAFMAKCERQAEARMYHGLGGRLRPDEMQQESATRGLIAELMKARSQRDMLLLSAFIGWLAFAAALCLLIIRSTGGAP